MAQYCRYQRPLEHDTNAENKERNEERMHGKDPILFIRILNVYFPPLFFNFAASSPSLFYFFVYRIHIWLLDWYGKGFSTKFINKFVEGNVKSRNPSGWKNSLMCAFCEQYWPHCLLASVSTIREEIRYEIHDHYSVLALRRNMLKQRSHLNRILQWECCIWRCELQD